MRRLGEYELQRHLRETGAAQIWQGQELAGGQPALVFVLPAAYLPAAQLGIGGAHPALLPLTRSGVTEVPGEGGEPGGRAAYLGTPLPPGAGRLHSLDRPGLLALLGALATLHRAGTVHGGICPELLWQDDTGSSLAGAGVPWGPHPDPAHLPDFAQDVRQLGQALAGVREEAELPAGWLPALRSATGPRSAQELLDRWLTADEPEPAAGEFVPAAQERVVGEQAAPARAAVTAPAAVAPAPGPAPVHSRPRAVSPWPWLLTSLALAGVLAGSFWAYQNLRVPGAPLEPHICCEVRYTVRGGEVPVRLQVLQAPPTLTVPSAQAEATAPGTMQLPGPGEYRIRVSAEGYAPQTISVTVPRSLPVAIELE